MNRYGVAGRLTVAQPWAARHNAAVDEWKLGANRAEPGREPERAILDLAAGIASWCLGAGVPAGGDHRGSDGFGGPNVTWELVCAFNDALNFDLGRLDGGTLSEFITWICTSCGIDADTGAWL